MNTPATSADSPRYNYRTMKYLLAALVLLILAGAGLKIMNIFTKNTAPQTLVYLPEAFQDSETRRFAEAVAKGDVKEAIRLLPSAPDGINALGKNNETVLLLATERLDLPMVEALLREGANPNGGPDRAPLAIAVRAYDLSVARLLLENGADPNGTIGTEPAIFKAALVGANEAIDLLIEYEARVDETDRIGSPASFAAAAADNWKTVELLLEYGASLWKVNEVGFTIGIYAFNSRLLAESEEGRAREAVISKLKISGFPWPPLNPSDIRAAVESGNWPPKK